MGSCVHNVASAEFCFCSRMWWEIVPSFALITGIAMIPTLAGRAWNRAIHDGLPNRRYYAHPTPMAMAYHKRDMQHSKPSFWQTYVRKDQQGNGTVYRCNNLNDLD